MHVRVNTDNTDFFSQQMERVFGSAPPTLLVVGDAVAPTGFATVIHAILGKLSPAYDIHHLGINYSGDPHTNQWKIYPASIAGDVFGVNRLDAMIEQIRPRLVFIVNDLWILLRYCKAIERCSYRPVVCTYLPIDAAPVEPSALAQIAGVADCMVAYTKFGENELRWSLRQALQQAHPTAPRLEVIPHGVDVATFHPLPARTMAERRRKARALFFPDRSDLHDAFIVLNANRNQPRKRIDLTLEGFALFARDKPDARLYLHMAREDLGWDVKLLAGRWGISHQVILADDGNNLPALTRDKLNLLYNACDVGLNTSCQEGWGLVSFEHAATGAAQIVPRHTTQIELWEGAAELVAAPHRLTVERVLTTAHFVDPACVARALDRLYGDPVYLQKMSIAAQSRATQRAYNWGTIARQWDALFKDLMSSRNASHRP
ncbi:MAG: glycosyltransferase family 4 protein [Alphaproteobacteria bacterium]|nr:glycosyltransferase family 4 protein [Alphaproteobacteria bacterium]